jgi:uncharacterized membrane protein
LADLRVGVGNQRRFESKDHPQASRPSYSPLSTLRKASPSLLGTFFVLAGLNHFLNPQAYLAMIPPYVPFPGAMNLISGAAEIAGGISVLIPRLRRAAGWGLIALLVAVFPANIHVALHGWNALAIPTWVLWARLPLQLGLIAWVHFSCLTARYTTGTAANRIKNA